MIQLLAFLILETHAPPTLDQSTVKKGVFLCKGKIIKQSFQSSLSIQVIQIKIPKKCLQFYFHLFTLLIYYDNINTRWHCDLQ